MQTGWCMEESQSRVGGQGDVWATVQRVCNPSIWNDFIPIWSDVTNKTRISKISLNTIFQLSLERFISRLEWFIPTGAIYFQN